MGIIKNLDSQSDMVKFALKGKTPRIYTTRKVDGVFFFPSTLPKFNIAPEKWWLEDYFPIGKVTFQGLC